MDYEWIETGNYMFIYVHDSVTKEAMWVNACWELYRVLGQDQNIVIT